MSYFIEIVVVVMLNALVWICDVGHAAARVAPVSRDEPAFVAVAEKPVVKPVRNPCVVLRVGRTGIYPVEELVGAVSADVVDFTRQSAAVSVLPGSRIKRGNDRVCLDSAPIPNLVGLALQPILAFKRKVDGKW